jgi:sulfopyruvate decarboxylase alpha subunit
MDSHEFWTQLKSHGFTFFAGVPDSTFEGVYHSLYEDTEIRYIPAPREDVALGIASAAYFAGRRGGVIMQNSGVGNIINPLTSFSLMYKVPILMLIGWRGFGGPPNDAPEHWIMGTKTTEILDLLDVPYEILEPDNLNSSLEHLVTVMDKRSVPGALLVRAGVIQ